MPAPTTEPAAAAPVGRSLIIVLGLLTVFGPISMDLYLPVLPALGGELGASTSLAQVTITACVAGLASGQLLVGPLSDRFGRRRPLLIGVGVYVLASVLCAISPTVEVLIMARLLQGLAGSTGMVIAQATGRDHFEGPRLVRYYGNLAVLTGVAAIIGPLLGGLLSVITGWRGIFTVLAGLGGAIWLAAMISFTESLPPERRTAGGRELRAGLRRLITDPGFVGPALIVGLITGTLFAYLGGATFVLQDGYRLTPQQFSYVFAAGSVALVIGGFLSGRLSARHGPRALLPYGLGLAAVGGTGILGTALLGLPLPIMIVSIVALTGGAGVTGPPATALALSGHPEIAGTAASLLGLTRYAIAAITAPLAGVAGGTSAVPLGVIVLSCVALAGLSALLLRGTVESAG
ncbi:multidrug effflux MFS transporter [Microlunatus sp. GCM10028923]|uniref:multidrug effflux MFS transporter n=1 Tax=Microlunatus sp. GCM10028923 TaxID=3273400 RepID=UPI003610196F